MIEQLSSKDTLDAFSNLHLLVRNSFMKTSTIGKLMWSFLRISRIFLNWEPSLSFFNLLRTRFWVDIIAPVVVGVVGLLSFCCCYPQWQPHILELHLPQHVCFYPTLGRFSGQTSTSLPLLKVIGLSCSLQLASVLLRKYLTIVQNLP